jgi:hypothetical protein
MRRWPIVPSIPADARIRRNQKLPRKHRPEDNDRSGSDIDLMFLGPCRSSTPPANRSSQQVLEDRSRATSGTASLMELNRQIQTSSRVPRLGIIDLESIDEFGYSLARFHI